MRSNSIDEEPEQSKTCCQKCCVIPQRYVMVVVASMGVISGFALRNLLGVAFSYIIKKENLTEPVSPDRCNVSLSSKTFKLRSADYYDWDKASVFKINKAFFWAYLVGQVPAGYLSDMYGGKHVFGCSILFSAVFTALTPVVIKYTRDVNAMIFLRFLFGLAQSVMFPALNSFISAWTPGSEMGRLSGIAFSTTQFATVLNHVISPRLRGMADWSYIFYYYSGVCFIWWLIWLLFCHSYPTQSPFIGEREELYLQYELEGHIVYGKKPVPWFKMLTSAAVWAVVLIQIGHTWIWHSMFSDLPAYIRIILNYNTKESFVYASMPYALMGGLTVANGFILDYIVNRRFVTPLTARQMLTTIGAMGPGIFAVAATFASCQNKSALVMFCVGLSFMASYYTGSRIVTLDLAPNYSGCIMGLANGLGALPGLIQPSIKKALVKTNSIAEWRLLLLTGLLFSTFTNIVFAIWGSSSEQSWNRPKVKKESRRSDI